jgi:hypothetical protein
MLCAVFTEALFNSVYSYLFYVFILETVLLFVYIVAILSVKNSNVRIPMLIAVYQENSIVKRYIMTSCDRKRFFSINVLRALHQQFIKKIFLTCIHTD